MYYDNSTVIHTDNLGYYYHVGLYQDRITCSLCWFFLFLSFLLLFCGRGWFNGKFAVYVIFNNYLCENFNVVKNFLHLMVLSHL